MHGLWLVQWTGRGAVVGQAERLLYFRFDDQSPSRLMLATGWRIYNGVLHTLDVRLLDEQDRQSIKRATTRCLARVGALTGASIRDFAPAPVYYQPNLCREFWLGSPTELQALLLANTKEYDEG